MVESDEQLFMVNRIKGSFSFNISWPESDEDDMPFWQRILLAVITAAITLASAYVALKLGLRPSSMPDIQGPIMSQQQSQVM